MKNKKIKTAIRTVIGLIILFLIISFIGLEKIIEVIEKIKIEYFILVVLFFLISTVFTTLAIMPLLKTKKFYRIFKFKLISWSTGMFLPSKIGEASFALLLKNTGITAKKSIAVFFIDRFVSFSIIGILAVIGAVKYFGTEIKIEYAGLFLIGLVVLVLLKEKIKKIQAIKKIARLFNETKEYIEKEKKAIALNYIYSFINFVVMFIVIQIIFTSVGEQVSLIDVALISSLATLISLIPVTINGLGIREGTLIYLYSLVGVKPECSALMAFVFLITSYLMAGAFLAAYYNEFSFILKKRDKKWLK